jgi:HIRAN domain
MTYTCPIAGIPHRKPIRLPEVGDTITLEPEPTNPYDPNAIKCMFDMGGEAGVVHIGYIPKIETATVRGFGITSMKVQEVVPTRKWTEVILEHVL